MPRPKPDDQEQSRQFTKAARDLGCDPDEGRFQDALRKVAKHKPLPVAPSHSDKDSGDQPGDDD